MQLGSRGAVFKHQLIVGGDDPFTDGEHKNSSTNNCNDSNNVLFNQGVTFFQAQFNLISFYKTYFSGEFLAGRQYGAEFNYVTITGYARFMDCKIEHLSLKQTNILGRTQFEHCKIGRLLYETTVYGLLTFVRCDISDGDFKDQDCSHIVFRGIDNLGDLNFTNADLRETRFILGDWKTNSKPERDKKNINEQSNVDKSILEDTEYLKSREFQYRQLNKLYEDNQHYLQAGEFHLLEMQTRKERLNAEGGQNWDLFILWIYGFLADYGENWKKVFVSLVVSFFIMAFLINFVEVFNPKNELTYWYSLKTVLLGIIPSGFQKTILLDAKLSVFSQFLIALQTIISLTLTTLFVMTLRRRFRR